MYEYGIDGFDKLPRIVGPLCDLRNRFCDETDTLKLIGAYERYVQEELGVSEREADTVITGQQRTGILPTTETLLTDRIEALDGYRMAICKTIMPYKSMTCSPSEYALWLPTAFDLVIPSDEEARHLPDVCLITNGMTDESCEIGDCPIKYLRRQAEEVQDPDFSTPDYMIRPERTYLSVHEFLSCARNKSIITHIERKKYRAKYVEGYSQAFPGART